MNEAPTINADVIAIAQTKLDMPKSAPVLYVSRDTYNGKEATCIDLWVAKPGRLMRDSKTTVYAVEHDRSNTMYLGAYTPDAVREALGFVPAGNECICIDNPRVN